MNESVFIGMRKAMAELLYNMTVSEASEEEVKSLVNHTAAMIEAYKAFKYYSKRYPSKKEDTEKSTFDIYDAIAAMREGKAVHRVGSDEDEYYFMDSDYDVLVKSWERIRYSRKREGIA